MNKIEANDLPPRPLVLQNWLFFVLQVVDFIVVITKIIAVEEIDIFWDKNSFDFLCLNRDCSN